MAFRQRASLSLLGVLFVAASMSCATATDIASPDGLAGRKLLLEDFGPKQSNPPTHENPLLQVSTEKKLCGKAPCPHPLPAPVDNGDSTVVYLDRNNAFEGIIPGGKKPPIAVPPCQVGVCGQDLAYERDFVARHIDQVANSQIGPTPSPDSNDYPQLAAWILNKEPCLANHKCSDPMKLCLKGRCFYPSHADRMNKAVADERDFGARHINHVDYPQPAVWTRLDVPCLAQCPDPMQACFHGFCVEPPHVDSVSKGFNRGGAVFP